MRFDVFTLFPQMFQGPLTESIIKRAVERGIIQIHIHNIRDWATDKHKTADDYPYGGGPGMVMKPEPIFLAVEDVLGKSPEERGDTPIILMSASGRRFEQKLAEQLSQKKRLALICGHYEGVDERVREHLATMELSIGDYVLSGGELPAMVVIDAVARLVPGVIDEESKKEESFTSGLLEYPQYTRPAEFRGMKVPEILLSGNHQAIASWRLEQALKRTQQVRPDLAAKWVQAHRAKQEEDC